MYSDIQYKDEDVVSSLETGTMLVNEAYKFIRDWQYYLYASPNTEVTLKMILDDDIDNAISATFTTGEGYFSPMYYSGLVYDTGTTTEDFKNFNVMRNARWVKFIMTCNKGRLFFRGYNAGADMLKNKEG